jgi:hypothetical protein
MVKKHMAMRMVTIFVALIVCGMFFPDLARGEDLSSDQGLEVNFEEVVIGGEKIIPLTITNQSTESTFTLILLLNMEAACEFTYTGPNIVSGFAPGDTLDVQVAFKPSAVGVCNAVLQIQYFGSGGLVEINFTGNGIEEVSETFIEIGGFNTGVLDREDEDGEYISDMISECQESAYNNGHMVRCIRRLTTHLRWERIISRKEQRALRNASWKAAMSNIMQAMKTAKRSGKRDHRSSRSWWLDLHHHWRH